MTESLPVRYCHGCKAYDDHPRFTHIPDASNAAIDLLYHYDCIPPEIREHHGVTDEHPALVATAAGQRGDELRATLKPWATSIPEDPADPIESE